MPLSKIVSCLALVAAAEPELQDAADRERWLARLYFPAPAMNFQFNLTAADLRGDTALSSAELVERASGELDESRPRTRLALARAYAAAGDPEASQAEFETLKTTLDEKLRANDEDWETLALLGETAFRFGAAFKNIDALKAADGYLRTARTKAPDLAVAAQALADLYLYLSLRVVIAGGAGEADEPLDIAIESAEAAIELAPGEFGGYATRFLASWLLAMANGRGDFDALTDRVVELTDELVSAGSLSSDEALVLGLADGLEASVLVGRCLQSEDPRDAWLDLPKTVATADELVESLAAITTHRRFGGVSRSLRWLVAYLAADEREAVLLEEAIDAAGDPLDVLAMKLSLAAWDEDWEAVDLFTARIEDDQRSAEVEVLLGSIAGTRDDFEASVAHYAGALADDEELPLARAGVAIAKLLAGGELSEAEEALAAVVGSDDELASAVFALGTVKALRGERDEALELLARAHEVARPRDRAAIEATRNEVEGREDK